MKTLKTMTMVITALFFLSCEKGFEPIDSVKSTFDSMFPKAKQIEWEMEDGYYVAEFRDDGKEKKAWFDQQAIWWLTETDIPKSQLPDAISQAIAASAYSSWRIDDIDYIEKKDATPFYVIEIESNGQDVDLYYFADGTFLGEKNDDDHNTPSPGMANEQIKSAVFNKYPNAKIIDVDIERDHIEIELVYGGVYWEMYMDTAYNWIRSERDYRWTNVPEVVKSALEAKGFTFNTNKDEVDQEVYPENEIDVIVYHFEIDKEPNDVHVLIREDGTDWP